MTQKMAVLQLFRMCGNVVTTAQFCSFMYLNERGERVGLASEYRRAIVEVRRDLAKEGRAIKATPVARGKWEYRLLPAQVDLFNQEAA